MTGSVEALAFGTEDPAAIDAAVEAFCVVHLGAAPAEVLFAATSTGVVRGLRLTDGRRVVVKAHAPDETGAALRAIAAVQRRHVAAGFPCPEPLLEPAPLGSGLATVETLCDAGTFRDTHDPGCRGLIAQALAWHLRIARACGLPPALARTWSLYAGEALWPPRAHSPRFDFAATADGAEWIDAIAARARPLALALAPAPRVLGHADWSGKHFRFDAGAITAVYDWDSLAIRTEAAIVGNAAMTFTTNFELPGVALAPAPEEVRAFVEDYDAERATPLSRRERAQIAACATFLAAYTARCEHSLGVPVAPGGFRAALREHGAAYLEP